MKSRDKVIVINPSRDDEYHTQINNKLVPHEACNVTSYVMAGKQADQMFKFPAGVQPEDHMMRLLRSPEAYDLLERNYKWAFHPDTGKVLYPPNEVHGTLVWAFNKLIGRNAASFTIKGSIRRMVYHIIRGDGVVLSGFFRLSNGTRLRHVVSLAGFKTVQQDILEIAHADDVDPTYLAGMIIDDPYGNPHTGYKDRHGNNLGLSMEQFDETMKTIKSPEKWMHVIPRVA